MKINFTKEQYETLLKTVFMGNWVANAFSIQEDGNPFDALEEYVFSHAKDFGLGYYADYVEEADTYYPSQLIEEDEDVDGCIQNYDDNIFWDKLIFNLARRDMEKEYKRAALEKMSDEELFLREKEFEKRYIKEFEKNGLKNLVISSDKKVNYRQKR